MSAEELHLGIAEILPKADLYRLRAVYFPIGKVGGHPAWLNPVKVPKADDLRCRVCEKSMSFVIQIYAAGQSDHAFHRYLYVFVCRNGECSKANLADNIRVVRMQLPRKNQYHGESPPDPLVELEYRQEFDGGERPAQLCNTCGLRAGSKCAKCETWYCSKDHQIVDWRAGHKKHCGTKPEEKKAEEEEDESKKFSISAIPASNPFLFREYGLKIIKDYVPRSELTPFSGIDHTNNEDSEEDDTEDDEESEDFQREQQSQYEELMEKLRSDRLDQGGDLADTIRNEQSDRYFQRFSRIVRRCPNQLLRYARHKSPLRPSDHTQMLENAPKCENCGSPRSFEFQLMPHLLSLMDVDVPGASIDWATVCVYTCSASCSTLPNGFLNEFATKHDFAVDEKQTDQIENDDGT